MSKNSQLCGRRFRHSDFDIPSDFDIRHSDSRIAVCSIKRPVSGVVRGAGSVHGSVPSTLLHVVAEDQVLIAQIEFSVRDHRMGPEAPLGIAYLRLRIELETAMLLPRFRRCFSEHHCAAVLVQAIQHPVRGTERSFAERVLFAPYFFAALEFLTPPP